MLALTACDPVTIKSDAVNIGNGLSSANTNVTSNQPSTPVEIGNLLYPKAVAFDKADIKTGVIKADPILVPQGHIVLPAKQDVPSELEGTIRWIGRPLRPGEQKPSDPFEYLDVKDPYTQEGQPAKIYTYIRLRVNDYVEKDKPVALLEDKMSILNVLSALRAMDVAVADEKSARKQVEYYDLEYRSNLKANKEGKAAVPDIEVAKSKAQVTVAESQAESKKAALGKSKVEFDTAQEKLSRHTISPALSGRVQSINKQAGDAIKAGETILQIQDTKHLQIEGAVDVQNLGLIQDGMAVTIQPSRKTGKYLTMPRTSSRPITAIATTRLGPDHLVFVASEDGSVHMWDLKSIKASFKHKEPVRTLACTLPSVAKQFIVTGCDDGKARLWYIGTPKSEAKEFDGHHVGGVLACAISPDGKYCVTSDERDIYLWETATGKKLYKFEERKHVQPVVKLAFLPQGRVVSVGKDNDAACVWKMGDKNATVERSFDHRGGEVSNLGVSDDGNRMLIDQDPTRLNIVTLGDGVTESTLQSPSESNKFAGLALLSPKLNEKGDRVIVTTGSTEGSLQVWKTPTGGGKSAELENLICDDNAQATAAAFSTVGVGGFIVAGTKKGSVYLWKLPDTEELTHVYKGVIPKKGSQVEPNGKTVRIIAELENPTEERWQLLPGDTATVIIQP